MKLIRAKGGIYVPSDPENSKSNVRLIQNGLLALVPDDFQLPRDLYQDLGRVKVKKEKENHNTES